MEAILTQPTLTAVTTEAAEVLRLVRLWKGAGMTWQEVSEMLKLPRFDHVSTNALSTALRTARKEFTE